MNDLAVHIALFLAISVAIVLCGAFYSDADDRRALAMVPRRLLWFVAGCTILVGIVLLIEHTVARVG